jgi:hypothetical protein
MVTSLFPSGVLDRLTPDEAYLAGLPQIKLAA